MNFIDSLPLILVAAPLLGSKVNATEYNVKAAKELMNSKQPNPQKPLWIVREFI